MVHQGKKKAPKGDDAFTAKKQKVGRKKLAPATATRAEVHARTLRINNAIPIADDNGDSQAAGVIPHRNFAENITACGHYKENVRAGAIGCLVSQVEEEGQFISPVHRLQALNAAVHAISDTDKLVRERAVTLLSHLLKNGAPDPQTVSMILQHAHIALTHAVFGVRRTGVEAVHTLLQRWPTAISSAADGSVEAALILDRVFEILAATPQANFSVLSCLLEKLLFDVGTCESPQSSAISCDAVVKLWTTWNPILLVRWKEAMELQYALFREASCAERACSLARVFCALSGYLLSCGALPRALWKQLKEIFVYRVPFTMQDMCSGNNARASDFAKWICTGSIIVLGGAVASAGSQCDGIVKSVTVCLTASLSTPNLALLDRSTQLMRLIVVLSPQWADKFTCVLPPLLQTVTRVVPSNTATLTSSTIEQCASILQSFVESRLGSFGDTLQHLATAMMLVPRLLFLARRLPRLEAATVAKKLLRCVWLVASSNHPVLTHVDVASFSDMMQSIFGVASGSDAFVPGIVESVGDEEVNALAVSIFYYLGCKPRSFSLVLPDRLPYVKIGK